MTQKSNNASGHNRPLTVVKVGGAVLEDAASLNALLDRFSAIDGDRILVHGGGRAATAMAARLGVETTMVAGRRITSAEMLDIVTMVYGGLISKRVVAGLQRRGVNAIGLSGADAASVVAHRRPAGEIDYGFVGDVDSVNIDALQCLLSAGMTPVMAPLSFDPKAATLLNTNADSIASAVAVAMSSVRRVSLVYCFELPGVLRDPADPSTVIPHITPLTYPGLVADGIVSGGMVPKLDNAFAALSKGVESVIITSASTLSAAAAGTRITLI